MLLPSTYGELGIDLQIIGFEIEVVCRFICMYAIIVCKLALFERDFTRSLFIGKLLIACLRSMMDFTREDVLYLLAHATFPETRMSGSSLYHYKYLYLRDIVFGNVVFTASVFFIFLYFLRGPWVWRRMFQLLPLFLPSPSSC